MSTNTDPKATDTTLGDVDETTDDAAKHVNTNDANENEAMDGDALHTARDRSPSRRVLHRCLVSIPVGIVLGLAVLGGWLGLQVWHTHQHEARQAEFLQTARQSALNLTTINWQHADEDVHRILDSSTGSFHDDFEQRSQPFIDVVKRVQSDSKGTITLAALESASDTDAQALVAVNVTTALPSAPQQDPRSWRMRIAVQKVGKEIKVSNVEFVP